MKYAVMFEPFPMEGYEYICKTDEGSWRTNGNPRVFNTKKEAKVEAKKWNTGIVVNMEETLK